MTEKKVEAGHETALMANDRCSADTKTESALTRRDVFTGILGVAGAGALAVACEDFESGAELNVERLKHALSGEDCCMLRADSVSELESLAVDAQVCAVAILSGYYLPGDGGGGVFYLDYDESSSSENGGTVFKALNSGYWKRIYCGPVNVRWFGATGDESDVDTDSDMSPTDNTESMKAAHKLGEIVYYPPGTYHFQTISMETGGIIGAGRLTQLVSTTTGSEDLITFTGNGDTQSSEIDNPVGAIFKDFFLYCKTENAKSGGAGIRIEPGISAMNYHTLIQNCVIRYVPICISLSNATRFTIKDCYLAYFTKIGIYEDNNVAIFEDNGDNSILNNWFASSKDQPEEPDGPKPIAIKYRGGGLRCSQNKINGGFAGIDLSPLRSSSIAIINGNSIENQANSCIRFITEDGTSAEAFSQVIIADNQLKTRGQSATAAIYVNPQLFSLEKLSITGNVISHRGNNSNAVDIRYVDEFTVSNNIIFGKSGSSSALRAIYIHGTAANGSIKANKINGFSQTALNRSDSVTEETIVQTGKEKIPVSTPYGPFFKGETDVDFPEAFRSAPNVMVQLSDSTNGGVGVSISNVTESSFGITLIYHTEYVPPNESETTNCIWRAEGLPK